MCFQPALGIESRRVAAAIAAPGHASVEDLQRLAASIYPDRVVPIHTDVPQRFASLFERVERHPNGEWWGV
jgi:mRNA degradation ribonuclease J1/J2